MPTTAPLPVDTAETADAADADAVDLKELTALALAADPAGGPAADAVPDPFVGHPSTLPAAYLPGSSPGPHGRGLAVVALALVALFVFIEAAGFCSTYGPLTFG